MIKKIINNFHIQNIFFDLDGTLVDTLELHIQAFQSLFKELGLEISYNSIAEQMGRTPMDIIKTLTSLDDPFYGLRKETILTELLRDITLFPGAFELLNILYNMDINLCLVSSTPMYNVNLILTDTNIKKFFVYIVSGDDIKIGKPAPEPFLLCAEHIRKESHLTFDRIIEKSLVIGDSIHDIEASHRAGLRVIAVATGKHSKEELSEAEFSVKNLIELL